MSDQTTEPLEINTGENDRETLRISHDQNVNTRERFLRVRISFPVYNPTLDKNMTYFAETAINVARVNDIASFLDGNDFDKDTTFTTGRDNDQSISFKDEKIVSKNDDGLKMRIFVPRCDKMPKRMAVTKLTEEDADKIFDYLLAFIDQVDPELNLEPERDSLETLQGERQDLADKINTLGDEIAEIDGKIAGILEASG